MPTHGMPTIGHEHAAVNDTNVRAVLQVADPGQPGWCPAEDEVQAWVRAAIAGAGLVVDEPAVVTVRLVSADESAALNGGYRDKKGPTNVLAFPAAAPLLPAGELEERELGDLVICLSVAAQEATAQGKDLHDHLAHLTVHGTLHLLGFDHAEDPQASKMERLEREVLGRLGIADPYAGDDR